MNDLWTVIEENVENCCLRSRTQSSMQIVDVYFRPIDFSVPHSQRFFFVLSSAGGAVPTFPLYWAYSVAAKQREREGSKMFAWQIVCCFARHIGIRCDMALSWSEREHFKQQLVRLHKSSPNAIVYSTPAAEVSARQLRRRRWRPAKPPPGVVGGRGRFARRVRLVRERASPLMQWWNTSLHPPHSSFIYFCLFCASCARQRFWILYKRARVLCLRASGRTDRRLDARGLCFDI